MSLKAIYPEPISEKEILISFLSVCPCGKTTVAIKEQKKFPYLLKQFKNEKGQVKIDAPNVVWGTKKILSWKISSTMDVSLTTSVLKEALEKYPKHQRDCGVYEFVQ